MSEKIQLKCDTFNDDNTYYVIDSNLGIEHEMHGAIQFKVVDKDGNVSYKSHQFSMDYYISELKVFEKERSDAITKRMLEGLSKSIKNDTLFGIKNGKIIKFSEWDNPENEGV